LQYIINNTYHSSVKSTPAKLMFGFDQRCHSDALFARFTELLKGIDADLEAIRDTARDQAYTATEAVRNYNKIYTDDRFRKPSQYNEGEYVLIRNTRAASGESAKLKPQYKGPYMITKTLGNNRYVIQDIPGFNLTQRPLNTVLSSDQIKRWIRKFEEKKFITCYVAIITVFFVEVLRGSTSARHTRWPAFCRDAQIAASCVIK